MCIFGPLSLLCWIYAIVYWLIFGVEPGYGGYDCYGNKIMSSGEKCLNGCMGHREGRMM